MGIVKPPSKKEALTVKSKRVGGTRSMHLTFGAPRFARPLVRHAQPELSRDAKRRLKWFDHYREHGNVSLTCRYFGISRQTFYRWKRRFRPHALQTLENRSCVPRRRRLPTWTTDQALAVQALREACPERWGKAKLQILLSEEGVALSVSMVGRILGSLKRRGALHEPPLRRKIARFRSHPRPYAIRKPRDYQVQFPGDLVQLDTVEIHPLPGKVLKHFTAHDVVSRWDVLDLHERATAHTAAQALDVLQERMPFPIRAIQIDGGSEFMAEFEEACKDRNIQLFVLPPRSPKLNGAVERANRTHRDEFYACTAMRPSVAQLAPRLLAWEQRYNTVRPHQALGYLTPLKFLLRYHPDSIRPGTKVSPMS